MLRLSPEEVRTVENLETVQVSGRPVSILPLAALLGSELPPRAPGPIQALLLANEGQRIALRVDQVLDERQVLLKGLGKQLARVRNVAGATITAGGKVALVLDVPALVRSAAHVGRPSRESAGPAVPPARKCVLVAEDSITSRTLLRNILEGAGYDVEVAIDGMDALTRLRTGHFDAVVSDVDMPRMNGLDLTEQIRRNPAWANLPVILVTALESRQDRERGIEVGANAYIVKSSFDQSNLIEVLQRLV